ncbi:uncharacterized protein LOC144653962 [Oculina patagonica]
MFSIACILLATTAFSVTSAATISSTYGFCVHEGEEYYPGEQIVLQDCQYKCQCVVNEGYSFFMCEPLCKGFYFDLTCADGEEPIMELEDTSVPECKCPRYTCPKRLSVANFIDYGTDEDGLFEPDLYEEEVAHYFD